MSLKCDSKSSERLIRSSSLFRSSSSPLVLCLESGVADGGVPCEQTIALQALVVRACDLVETRQRAREARIALNGHPGVV